MNKKITLSILDQMVEDYLEGVILAELSRKYGFSESGIKKRLDQIGVYRHKKRWIDYLPIQQIVSEYEKGNGIHSIAKALGFSNHVIERRLVDAGVSIRERKNAAKNAVDGWSPEKWIDVKLSRAQFRERNVILTSQIISHSEIKLGELLRKNGVFPDQQKAVGFYNCDLSIGMVDIEILGGRWHFWGNHLRTAPIRLRYFLNQGWDVLSIVVDKDHPITETTATQVIRFVKECKARGREEPRIYRMIRGTNDILINGTALDDPLKVKPRSEKP